jgi:hypothetical protein
MTTERAQRASIAGLAALALLAAVYLLHAGHGTVAFFDEWDWITRRRGISGDSLLGPHNGHLSLVPVLMYKALLQVAGLTHYWVFRVVLVLAHLVCVALMFLLARARVGTVGAAFAAAFIAVLGAAADDLVWAFQLGFVIGIAFGLGALLALDAGTRRGDVAAALLLGLSLASASVGVAFLIAAAVEIALDPRRRQRWWVIGAPLALYAAWYLGYGESQIKRENLGVTPDFAADSGSTAVGGIVGLTAEYGRVLLIGLVAAVAVHVARAPALVPRLVALAVAAPAIWVLTGLSRADLHEPQAPRYIYTGAVLVVLLICELARGRRVARPAQAVMLGALLSFAAVANANTVDNTAGVLRDHANELRARLGALALVADRVGPNYVPAPTVAPQLQAGRALEAQRDFGRIALSQAQLLRAPQAQGAAADDALRLAGSVTTAPTTDAGVDRAGCSSGRDVVLAPGQEVTVSAQAATGIVARRFAREFGQAPLAEVGPGGAVIVHTVRDTSDVPWRLRVSSAGRVEVCRAG